MRGILRKYSCVILKCVFRILRGYEGQLATIAMSNVESSRTVAQLLYDMKEFPS